MRAPAFLVDRGDAWELDPAGAGLGNAKSRVSGDPCAGALKDAKRNHFRRLMRALRRAARRLTTSKAVERCGRVRTMAWAGGPVELRRDAHGRAFYSGLLRCGSVWECPVCMDRIQTGRAQEVEALGQAHRRRGGELYLATLTIPHQFGHRLRELRTRLNKAWRRVQAGRAWMELRRRAGLESWIVAREVTVGPNGWHPHVHVLLFTARPLGAELEAELTGHLLRRWQEEVTRGRDWRAPSKAHGVNLKRADRESYVAKLAGELVRQGRKRARTPDPDAGRHRSPLELLEDVARHGRPQDVALWREYADAMRGACQLTYGGRFRRRAERRALGADTQTDLELAAVEEKTPALVLAVIDAATWDAHLAGNDALQCRLLEEAERRTPADAQDYLCRVLLQLHGDTPPPF